VDDGTEPIADDELLYRRVPASLPWYDPTSNELRPQAFGPNKKRDLTGISVFRAKYKPIEEVAHGQPGRSYFVAILSAGDVRRAGIRVEPSPNTPTGYDAAHAELPDLNAANCKDSATLERERVLVEVCQRVEGPFTTPPD
jgi:hypothetical protein